MQEFVKLVTTDDKLVIVNPAAVWYVSQGDEVCTLHFAQGVLTVRATLLQLQEVFNRGEPKAS